MTETCQAVIISAKTLREADILVRFATPGGRMTAVANSARRSQKRFPSGFPIGGEVEIVCAESKSQGLMLLQDMRIVHSVLGMDISPMLLGAMGYALELVDRSWPEHQASAEKFARLTKFLRALPASPPAPALQEFCWDWLGLLGFQPMVDQCVHCKRSISEDTLGAQWHILIESGGAVCPDCLHGDRGGIPMSAGWRRELIPVWIHSVLDLKLKSASWWPMLRGQTA